MDHDMQELERAVRADPTNPLKLRRLADAYERSGRIHLGQTLEEILEDFHSNDHGRRLVALKSFGSMGPLAYRAIPVILRYSREQADYYPHIFTRTLINLGPLCLNALLDSFDAALKSHTEDERFLLMLCRVLDRFGHHAQLAVPRLLRVLKIKGTSLPHQALRTLASIGPAAKEAVPKVLPLLKSSNHVTRIAATTAIVDIGATAAECSDILLRLLGDPVFGVRFEASRALGKLGPAVIPLILEALSVASRDQQRQKLLCRSLSYMGPKARAAIPELRAIASEADFQTRVFIEEAIRGILED